MQTVGDRAVEANVTGYDTVFASVSYSLKGQYIEALTLTGSADVNATGNALNNTLTGNSGVNVLTGKSGDDTYYVQTVGDRAVEAKGEGSDAVFSTFSYSLAGQYIERLTLTGSSDLSATGNGLRNTIIGNSGANVLDGGADVDTLTGGGGADAFAFSTALGASNVDVITDFDPVDDLVRLDDAVFRGLAVGALASNAFVVASAAQDASDRIIYDQAAGALFFDRDGTGSSYAAERFASIENNAAMTAADFTVV